MNGDAARRQCVIGSLVGSIVGDALGAPFEFGDAGRYTRQLPTPRLGTHSEMTGGGLWKPGEWTDDTQMALIVADSLVNTGGLDGLELFERFRTWANSDPADIGIATRSVLTSHLPWNRAATAYFRGGGLSAGNGSLMRATPAAIWFARAPLDESMAAARVMSALTHGDPAAGEGVALFHGMIAAALNGDDPLGALPDLLDRVSADHQPKWREVLVPGWTPVPGAANGDVWSTLATAVWALRTFVPHGGTPPRIRTDFADAMRAVIDLGRDTDTVAAVTGGLIGAVLGIQAVPSRWANAVNGVVPGFTAPSGFAALQALALRLDGEDLPKDTPHEAALTPREVLPGLWLTNLSGLPEAPDDGFVLSLSRTRGQAGRRDSRLVYLLDGADNLHLDTVLVDVLDSIDALRAEGRSVVVHCHGGHSRTGLILRAYLRRHQGLSASDATLRAQRLWPPTVANQPTFDEALARLTT